MLKLHLLGTAAALFAAVATNAQNPVSTGPIVWDNFEQIIDANSDGSLTRTIIQDVRPMSPEGAQGLSMIPFPVSRSLQRFELLEGWVQLPDGKKVPLDPATIITQAPPFAAQAGTLNDIDLKVLPIPQLAPGGRLHVAVRITQHTPYFPGRIAEGAPYLPFARTNPAVVTIRTPAAMPLKVGLRDWTATPVVSDGDKIVRRFTLPAQPFRPPEPGALLATDWAPNLVLSNFADWADVARGYQSRANAAEVPDAAITALAAKLTAGLRTDRDKAKAITDWVRDNIRYVNIALDLGGFVPVPASEVLAKGFGDCKGHTTLTIALLKAAGIDAGPALVNLMPTYAEPQSPYPAFNHVVVHLPGLGLFVDTTARYARFGELHQQLQDKFALLTRTGQTVRMPMQGEQPDTYESRYDLAINTKGEISGTSETRATGNPAIMSRGQAAQAAAQDQAQFARQLMAGNGSAGTATVAFSSDGAVLKGDFKLATPVDLGSTAAVRLPYAIALLDAADVSKEAGGVARTTPWGCAPTKLSERFTLKLPDNVTLVALPKAASVDTPLIRYTSSYSIAGNIITATREYQSRYPSKACTPAQDQEANAAKQQIARDVAAQIIIAPKA
jgi:hypothetical protein